MERPATVVWGHTVREMVVVATARICAVGFSSHNADLSRDNNEAAANLTP
ncbi:MAG: hypothetical protein HY313_04410, partial [Acidobacteria bacterium]|nr:hypothetical protein [Acidobacteriota bacterium]